MLDYGPQRDEVEVPTTRRRALRLDGHRVGQLDGTPGTHTTPH
jgi:hypothetical protein